MMVQRSKIFPQKCSRMALAAWHNSSSGSRLRAINSSLEQEPPPRTLERREDVKLMRERLIPASFTSRSEWRRRRIVGPSFPLSCSAIVPGPCNAGPGIRGGLVFPVQNGDGSVDQVTVFCGDIIFSLRGLSRYRTLPSCPVFTGKQVAADDFLGVKTDGYLAAVASSCPNQGFPVMQGGFFAQKDRERSVPSGEPASAPVRAHSVGITSAWKAGWAMVFPGAIFPGQRIMPGTRMPPS